MGKFADMVTVSGYPTKDVTLSRSRLRNEMGIPVKVNMIPEGSRTAFRSEDEQQSERSDAGVLIVKESVRNGQAS